MKGIFISYRREDSAPHAGRICDYLRRVFPSLSIFMDVDAVNPGADFVKSIDANLIDSGVVLAVIGPRWDSVQDSQGRRRLDNAEDYVVRELATALQRQSQVIPVLVGGARMPAANTLPTSLGELARRNAMEVDDLRFAEDVERLRQAVAQALGIQQDERQALERKEYARFFSDAALSAARIRFRRVVWASYALLLLSALFGMLSATLPKNADVSAVEPPQLNCTDASLKTDEQVATCKTMNTVMSNVTGEFDEWAKVVVAVVAVVFYLFLALVNAKLLRGKNWARVVYVIIGVILAMSIVGGLSEPVAAAVYVPAAIAYAWAIRMMFTDPVRRWFRRA